MNQPTSASLETIHPIQVDRLNLAGAGQIQAKEAFRIDQKRYAVGVSNSAGVSPQLELCPGQPALTLTSTNRVNAWIDLRLAQTTFNHAAGKVARPLNTKGHPPEI